MQSTRERVMKTLLKSQQCTINDLADAVDINPISVRHHIAKLQAEGLVDSMEERHGVGRPRRLYFLTETGLERFPTRYIQMSNRLLDQIKQQMPEADVRRLFSQMANGLVEEEIDHSEISDLNIEERLNLVKKLLMREGFTVEWEKIGDEYHIRETNCPYLQVGQNHPEICAMDQTLISAVLAVPSERVKCILNGDQLCTYVIPKNAVLEIQHER
ncbi:MAG: helix-turn-helix transcriptional regulator [Anaerolineales bacterium]|jgi:DeoR family suf operon transcriptional repressor